MAKITPFNMSRILRKLNYRTGQSRKITYYRPPVYSRDDYGVEASGVAVNELVMPNTQAYIRLRIGKDYQLQKAGVNIVGTATVYMPRLETLKNFMSLPHKYRYVAVIFLPKNTQKRCKYCQVLRPVR